jgi:hypothetical protein
LRRSDHPSSAERPRRPPRCCWSPRSASASDRRRRCLHAARAPRARRRESTHVRNPRSALDARRRVRRGRHLAVIALLGSRGALLALRVGGPAAVATAWPALRALDRRMAGRDVTSSCCTRLHSGARCRNRRSRMWPRAWSGSSSPRGPPSSRKAKRASRSTSSQLGTPK